jgi:hypothetical protein
MPERLDGGGGVRVATLKVVWPQQLPSPCFTLEQATPRLPPPSLLRQHMAAILVSVVVGGKARVAAWEALWPRQLPLLALIYRL